MIPEELVAAARDNLPEEEAEYLAPLDSLIKEGRSTGERGYEAFRQKGFADLLYLNQGSYKYSNHSVP